MEEQSEPTREYVKELLWAAFMINLIMATAGLLVGAQLEELWLGLGVFLGGGLTITGILALVVLGNAGIVWLLGRRQSRVRKGSGH